MLSLIIFFPFVYGLILFLFPKKGLFGGAVFGSLLQACFCSSLFYFFDPSSPDLQMAEAFPLVPLLGVNYFVGIDGISFWYVLLNALLLPLVVIFSKDKTQPLYFFLLFALSSLCSGLSLVLIHFFFISFLNSLFFLCFS